MKKGVDCIGVAVVYFCHDGNGQFIMAKRSKNTRDEHGRWDIGGGGLEFGDNLEETIRKEIKEEYGTDVVNTEFLGVRDVHREHEGTRTHWVALDYKVQVKPEMVRNCEPHKFDEIGWFSLNSLPDPIHSQFPNFLNLYWEKLKNHK